MKRKLQNKTLEIEKMKGELKNLRNELDINLEDNIKYEVDDGEVDSDLIPEEIKNKIKMQVKKDIANEMNI